MLLKKHNLVFVKKLAEQVQIQTSRKKYLFLSSVYGSLGNITLFLGGGG